MEPGIYNPNDFLRDFERLSIEEVFWGENCVDRHRLYNAWIASHFSLAFGRMSGRDSMFEIPKYDPPDVKLRFVEDASDRSYPFEIVEVLGHEWVNGEEVTRHRDKEMRELINFKKSLCNKTEQEKSNLYEKMIRPYLWSANHPLAKKYGPQNWHVENFGPWWIMEEIRKKASKNYRVPNLGLLGLIVHADFSEALQLVPDDSNNAIWSVPKKEMESMISGVFESVWLSAVCSDRPLGVKIGLLAGKNVFQEKPEGHLSITS